VTSPVRGYQLAVTVPIRDVSARFAFYKSEMRLQNAKLEIKFLTRIWTSEVSKKERRNSISQWKLRTLTALAIQFLPSHFEDESIILIKLLSEISI